MSSRILFAVGVVVALAACGPPSNYGRSVNGTEGGYSMGHVYAKPATPLVARKIARPLYIVLDDMRVRDGWQIATPACQVGGDDCEKFALYDAQLFVRRDLVRLMSNYFSRVEVIAPGAKVQGPHVIADVKVDDMKLRTTQVGPMTYTFIDMTWGIAMRRGEDADYAFSYAATASSNDTYPTFEAGLVQLVENSLGAMSTKWTASGTLEKFYD